MNAGDSSGQRALELIDESTAIIAGHLDEQVGDMFSLRCFSSDKQLFQFKDTVTDPSISRSLAAYWEKRFFADMKRLHVREPDTLTRVTEYVPETVEFVEQVVKNGCAYESEGSVYFDTNAFENKEGHFYAKLEPWSKGNREKVEEGEGQ